MDKRYQVFISSTYTDLQEERQKVIQTLMEMDCIPAGMELFPAADEEQFRFIKKVIDDCDYYLLIIGGRYGSLTSEGISYTEMEYEYAVSKNLKVIAFIHGSPESIPVYKSDTTEELKAKSNNFRNKVAENRLIRFWTEANQLPGLVSLSLNKAIKQFPAIGWVRADTVASQEILYEINELRKKNALLLKENNELSLVKPIEIENLADFDELFEIHFAYKEYDDYDNEIGILRTQYKMAWRNIFSVISPKLQKQIKEQEVRNCLLAYIIKKFHNNSPLSMDDEDFDTIGIQLTGLGLIHCDYEKINTTWSLTNKGKEVMMDIKTIKK